MTVIFRAATWKAALFMIIYVITASIWASVIITLLALGVVLLPLGVGLPMLVATLSLARVMGGWDRRLVNQLLGGTIAAPPAPSEHAQRALPDDASWWRRTATLAGDASSWRHVAWITAGPVTGAVGFTAAMTAIAVTIAGWAAVAEGAWTLYSGRTVWTADIPAEWEDSIGWVTVAAGLILLLLSPALFWMLRGLAAATRAFARWALGPSRRDDLAAATARAERAEAQVKVDQELHDSIGHMITMTVVQAGAAAHVFDSNPEFAREALRTIEERGRAAMGDLDRIIATIQGNAPTSPLQGAESIEAVIADARAAGMDIASRVAVPPDLPAPVGRAAYSTVREVVTNAARHAPGAPVTLSVAVDNGVVRVLASNAASRGKVKGSRKGGQGIGGMRDRIELLGGSLSAGVIDGEFVVDARIPIADPAVASTPDEAATRAKRARKGKR